MKTNFLKKTAMIGGLLLSVNQLSAQETSSSSDGLKPFSPVSSYRTWSFGIHGGALNPELVLGGSDFRGINTNIGYGAYIKKQVLHGFGFRADFLRGAFEGTNSNNGAYSGFKTDLNWSGSLNVDLTLANVNFLHGKSAIMPYVSAGAGYMSYDPTLTTKTGTTIKYGNVNNFFIPLGAGLKFGLGKGVNLDLGYQANFMDGDDLDGFKSDDIDKFGYAHAGLEFALGASSKPQLARSNPVKVMYDDYVAQNQLLKNDLAAQRSATEAALAAQKTAMQQQLAELQAQLKAALADSDGDGVIDKLDKCPNTPAGVKVDGSGCPLPEAKNVTTIITEEDRRVVKEAITNLEFDFGKATIRAKSFPSLDRVAALLVQKNFSLKLAGHTDNVGSDAANLKLSKDRAESVKAYLVSKGANSSRVEAVGYGESQPIATNATETGRQQNRRVEFTLY
ncbi:DUF6089 family protein [Hufsiella ginkgonis]|uniref:OmpA family protein n=1 Tax=Hufsiella ginkgonis TaxID=2695274 RepID=A0A7K1XZ95_9SPHI|nr:DUF6089 family protein [Hufsiella ginkgonis]MXV16334.1 OmpA family protein [Hufsiella ginkgonis]